MRHRREDVVNRALAVLDEYGLGDLSMRRIAGELGVQPSALYHHVPNKQALLALVADEILERGPHAEPGGGWRARAAAICLALRDAMLAWRDGAELVSTVYAFELGAGRPYAELLDTLADAGFTAHAARIGARTLLHATFGHAGAQQAQLQAASAGAVDAAPYDRGDDLAAGLDLILSGLAAQRRSESRRV
ncbi:TetR family transcriptional regulator [Cumulibacter manganitolerans]|uniref:TetR family transcriptional regulator n=1 Tax=Cumulibacter manganitolerans TaxID=1884992 RepID=UPI0012981076|nr:TetR family transcriptional regulator [Cumulibacter manganitolerans]